MPHAANVSSHWAHTTPVSVYTPPHSLSHAPAHSRFPACTQSVSCLHTVGFLPAHSRFPACTQSVSCLHTVSFLPAHSRFPACTQSVSCLHTVSFLPAHSRFPACTQSVSCLHTMLGISASPLMKGFLGLGSRAGPKLGLLFRAEPLHFNKLNVSSAAISEVPTSMRSQIIFMSVIGGLAGGLNYAYRMVQAGRERYSKIGDEMKIKQIPETPGKSGKKQEKNVKRVKKEEKDKKKKPAPKAMK
ncbi:uncharacterized protein LOC142491088 [Ascaphus truei]|uniref:uncharacterized protein LOC142491088 n=1 Tax=Ascaphus truei TaxID=8439 RepID=UPI003F59B9E3